MDWQKNTDMRNCIFLCGDIAEHEGVQKVDMDVTLHACEQSNRLCTCQSRLSGAAGDTVCSMLSH